MIPISLYLSPYIFLIIFIWSLIYNGYKTIQKYLNFTDPLIKLGFGGRLDSLKNIHFSCYKN